MSKRLSFFVDYGFVILKHKSQVDGFFTFGKHRYQHISNEEVTRHYLVYLYVRLKHQPAGCPQEILDVIWFWGDRKGRIEAELAVESGELDYYPDFDELVEEQEEYYRKEQLEKEQYVLPGVSMRGYRRVEDGALLREILEARKQAQSGDGV